MGHWANGSENLDIGKECSTGNLAFGLLLTCSSMSIENPLACNFLIERGQITVKVPKTVEPRDDYFVVCAFTSFLLGIEGSLLTATTIRYSIRRLCNSDFSILQIGLLTDSCSVGKYFAKVQDHEKLKFRQATVMPWCPLHAACLTLYNSKND